MVPGLERLRIRPRRGEALGKFRDRLVAVLLLLVASVSSQGQQQPAGTAALAGVVRDSLGHGLDDVEVVILGGSGTRTDSAGRFLLSGVTPGRYEVWFRRIGFSSSQFSWQAVAGARTEVEAHLRLLPHTLDPMVVRARESRAMRSSSSIVGYVVDSSGAPLAGVEVQLVGAGRSMATRTDGSFAFPHVLPGEMTVRTRRMGFAPATLWLRLGDDNQREVTLRMHRLAQTLDAVEVRERSGFGASEQAWRDFAQRQNFRFGNLAVYMGPDALRGYGGTPLDIVAATSAIRAAGEMSRLRNGTTSIRSDAITPTTSGPTIAGDACILEDGIRPRRMPLRAYSARDVEAIEYYPPAPPESELTSTIRARFGASLECAPSNPAVHPAYWVIWLKQSGQPPR